MKVGPIMFQAEVQHFRASDTEGGRWNPYGRGTVKIPLDLDSGRAMVRFVNTSTQVDGLNICVTYNMPMIRTGKRVDFKALSNSTASNGKKNFYAMKFDEEEHAVAFEMIWNAFNKVGGPPPKTSTSTTPAKLATVSEAKAISFDDEDKSDVGNVDDDDEVETEDDERKLSAVADHSGEEDEDEEEDDFAESQNFFVAFPNASVPKY